MFLSKRNGIYYIFYENDLGKRTCKSTKTKLKRTATECLITFRDELSSKRALKIQSISLREFINRYLSHSAIHHTYKTSKDYKYELNKFLEFVGDKSLVQFNSTIINNFLELRNKVSIYSYAKSLRYLRSVFNWAVSNNYITENPCKSIRNIKIPEKQPLFFSESEFNAVLNTIDNNDISDIVVFAVNTGLRQMEILSLEWNQINLSQRFVILNNHSHTTKSKRIRSVPLNHQAFQVIERRMKLNAKFLFTLNGEQVKPDYITKKFKKYIIQAGANPNLKFHSLRHTFASWLVQRGVSIYEVSKLLGHSDIKTTQIYSHLRAEDLRESVNVLNN